MWSEFDELQYQQMKKDLEEQGDHLVKFNGVTGPLSLLIKSVEIVRSMFVKSLI